MVLSDGQIVEHVQDALDNLDRRIRAIRVLTDPHLEEATSLHFKEHLLDMLLFQKLSDRLDELESSHGSDSLFDAVVV